MVQSVHGHVLTKSIEQNGVAVVFQFWLKSETEAALFARLDAERARTGDREVTHAHEARP